VCVRARPPAVRPVTNWQRWGLMSHYERTDKQREGNRADTDLRSLSKAEQIMH